VRTSVVIVTFMLLVGCGSERPRVPPGSGAPALSPAATDTIPSTTPVREWVRRADAPLALTEVAATAHEGVIWVAGGLDRSGAVAAVMRYDPLADAWDRAADMPEAVHHSSLVSTGDDLLLVGGYVGSAFDRPTAAVRRWDSASGTWVDHVPLPEPRAAGAAGWNGEDLVLYAGGVGTGGVSDAVWVLENGTWRGAPPLSLAREHLAGAGPDHAGWVFVLGGRQGGLDANLGRIDLVNGTETLTLSDEFTPRGGVAAFWSPAVGPCLVGGEGPQGTFGQVECVDDDTVYPLPSLAHPRHGLGAAVVDGTAFALLGGEQPGLYFSSIVESLDLGGR
jgi:hypothetical protein